VKLFTVTFGLLFLLAQSAGSETLRMLYMSQAGYQPRDIQARAEEYLKETDNEVRLTFTEYEDVYDLVQRSAAKRNADFDIILADQIWMDDYLAKRALSAVPERLAREISEGIVQEIYRPFEKDGRFWAFPFLANYQLFFVNKGLLARAGFDRPPATLEEMVEMARTAKKTGVVKYPLFAPWNKQESLICCFTIMTGAFGGSLLDGNGRPKVDSAPCVRALQFMGSLLDDGLMNPYSLRSDEVFAAEAFLIGDVLFETNWTFVTGRMKKNIYPSGGGLEAALIPVSREAKSFGSTSTVSGYQGLAVTSNSTHKEQAWHFVEYLASPQFQRQHLSEMSVWKEVWDEKRTAEIDPDIGLKKAQLAGVHDRPGNPKYRAISRILQDAIYSAFKKRTPPGSALALAQSRIEALR
jgi:multiple sugar transport system substrate-binding protein